MSIYLSSDPSVFFGIPSISKMSTGTDLRDYAGEAFPKKLLATLTSHCNLRCTHCERSKRPQPGAFMPRERIDEIIAAFFDRIESVYLGGLGIGEQMLSPHLEYVLRRASDKGVEVDLLTNGTMIDAKNARLLADTLARLQISVEGVGPNYRAVRGIPWERLIRGIEVVLNERERSQRGRKPRLVITLTVLRDYTDDCFELLGIASRLGIDLIVARDFFPRNVLETRSSLLYFPQEHRRFYDDFRRAADSQRVLVTCPPPVRPWDRRSRARKTCSFPFEVFGMQVDGSVVPCCTLNLHQGFFNRRGDELKCWRGEEYVRLRRTVNSDSPLPQCERCETVGLNPASWRPSLIRLLARDLFRGSPLAKSPLLYRLAQKTYQRL